MPLPRPWRQPAWAYFPTVEVPCADPERRSLSRRGERHQPGVKKSFAQRDFDRSTIASIRHDLTSRPKLAYTCAGPRLCDRRRKRRARIERGDMPPRCHQNAPPSHGRARNQGGILSGWAYVQHTLTADIISRIWHDDGLRGYYRGLVPTMVGYLPTWAIYFVVYDKGKTFFSSQIGTLHRRAHTVTGGKHDFLIHICSAMTAGVVSTTCTSPFWVVKTRTMVRTRGSRSSKRPSSRPINDITTSLTRSERSMCARGSAASTRDCCRVFSAFSTSWSSFPCTSTSKAWLVRRRLLTLQPLGSTPTIFRLL